MTAWFEDEDASADGADAARSTQRPVTRRRLGRFALAVAGLLGLTGEAGWVVSAAEPERTPSAEKKKKKKKKPCKSGTTLCGKTCVNLQTDSANCGKCGTACKGSLTCVQGRCGCSNGRGKCGNACYDFATDKKHCGGCATACNATVADRCRDGRCKCGSGPACSGNGVACTNGVCRDYTVCSSCTYTTVQAAVDAAPAGAVIPIAAETINGQTLISKNVTLRGAGRSSTTLTASTVNPLLPIVFVEYGTTVRIENLKITGGNHQEGGGGIVNWGNLTLDGCEISGNQAAIIGGGILNQSMGSLTLIDTIMKDNTSGRDGGGIFSSGPLTITGSEISGNEALGSNGLGGGIYLNGNLDCRNTTISNNEARIGGGASFYGIPNTTPVWSFTDCDVDGNSARSAGGVFTQRGTLQIKGSTTIRRNTATSTSGGLELATGTQAVMQDTAAVSGNTVTTDTGYGGGVTINRGNAGVPGQPDQPGASLVLNDAASISDNTLTCSSSSNGGGGGVYVDGSTEAGSIARLTLNGTSKIQGNSAPNSSGGGIRNLGSVTLSSGCLISGNTASSGLGGGGGGISSGGIFAPNATLTGNTDTNVTNNTPNNVVISS